MSTKGAVQTNTDEAEEEDDLYADLDFELPDRSTSEMEGKSDVLLPIASTTDRADDDDDPQPLPLTEEVLVLRKRLEDLERENSILRRNMGTLYRTAVAELERKDGQIAELQQKQQPQNVRDQTPPTAATTPEAAARKKE